MAAKLFRSTDEWERINATTDRLEVPGGWLYKVKPDIVTFVADPPLYDAIRKAAADLGTGNAATPMGAIEAHSLMVKEAGNSIADALHALARAVEEQGD